MLPMWHELQTEARIIGSRISYIPQEALFSGGEYRQVANSRCLAYHCSDGPWQPSQLTPSCFLNNPPRGAFGLMEWQFKQRSHSFTSCLRSRPICSARGPSSTAYAWACLSFSFHVLYSVSWT